MADPDVSCPHRASYHVPPWVTLPSPIRTRNSQATSLPSTARVGVGVGTAFSICGCFWGGSMRTTERSPVPGTSEPPKHLPWHGGSWDLLTFSTVSRGGAAQHTHFCLLGLHLWSPRWPAGPCGPPVAPQVPIPGSLFPWQYCACSEEQGSGSVGAAWAGRVWGEATIPPPSTQ